MNCLRIVCLATLLACEGCSSAAENAAPENATLDLMDVSGDDCTASVFVFDRPPVEGTADQGTPFINDGCFGNRIFLGIDGERRELTRAENLPLGLGGEYSDGEYRVLVTRGQNVRRVLATEEQEISCDEPEGRVYFTTYEADVLIRSRNRSWRIDGAIYDTECGA